MIRWLRVVLPPGWVLALAAIFYIAMLALLLLVVTLSSLDSFGRLGLELFRQFVPQATAPYLAFLAAGYGVHRICVYHPALRPGYFEWLCGTPWNSKKPLPLGPIHLVWQDVVVLGLATAAVWPTAEWRSLMVVQTFVVVYLLGLAFVLYLTGEKLWSYALAFGVGWLLLFRTNSLVFLGDAALCYGMSLEALRRSLARFPWDVDSTIQGFHLFLRRSLEPTKKSRTSLGWPYVCMGPEFTDLAARGARRLAWYDVLCSGLLAGWAYFVIEHSFPTANPGAEHVEYLLYYAALFFFIVGRLAIYCDGYVPPLSLLGRLAHLRPIIPGYDQVFVAPLLALVVAAAAWYVPEWTGADTIVFISIAIAADWWILFGMGPSLQTWRLTGNHRITRSLFQKDLVRAG